MYPILRPEPLDISCTLNQIAIALNGISIFSGAVDGACTKLDVTDCDSEWISFDCCGGHASPNGGYHYHFAPSCLLDQVGNYENGHSGQIGWAPDGLPIYGPHSVNGVRVQNCGSDGAHETYCQDACGGIEFEDPSIDGFKYRYYMTGYLGDLVTIPYFPRPDTASMFPFTIDCLKGYTLAEYPSDGDQEELYTHQYMPSANEGIATPYEFDVGDNRVSGCTNSISNWESTCTNGNTGENDWRSAIFGDSEGYASVPNWPESYCELYPSRENCQGPFPRDTEEQVEESKQIEDIKKNWLKI